jgi:hypothetical protein
LIDDANPIKVTMSDLQQMVDSNPVFALQAKCLALIRILEERDTRILELESQLRKALKGSKSHVQTDNGKVDPKVAVS